MSEPMKIGEILTLLGLTEEGVRLRTEESKRAYATYMRENQTPAERMMARVLYHLGINAEPQVYLMGWIVDFFDADNLTVIEVDGSSHDAKDGEDASRDEAMERAGYRVIRIRNDQVRQLMADIAEAKAA